MIVGGWDADSIAAGALNKRCRMTVSATPELGDVQVDRWAELSIEPDLPHAGIRRVEPAKVYLHLVDTEMTPEQAEALAAELLEAARLARL